MKWLRSRRFLAASYRWKRERLGALQAECRILETLQAVTRQELADTRALEGDRLALMFGSLSAENVENAMRDKREYERTIEETWLAGEHHLKSKGKAA